MIEIKDVKSLTNLGSIAGAFILGTLVVNPANVEMAIASLSEKWNIGYFIALLAIPFLFSLVRLVLEIRANRDMADDSIRSTLMKEDALRGMIDTRNSMLNSREPHHRFLGKYLQDLTSNYRSGNGTQIQEGRIDNLWTEAQHEAEQNDQKS